MSAAQYVLALDQGTTSSRSLLVRCRRTDRRAGPARVHATLPAPWLGRARRHRKSGRRSARRWPKRLRAARATPRDVAAVGITNQRETTVLWDRATPASRWRPRSSGRTGARRPHASELRAAGHEPEVSARTGLVLDPYFSGTKLAWLLDHVPGARARAERGELAFGTVDSWLLFKLSGASPSRHRRHQRQPDTAAEPANRRLGRSAARAVACSARLPARGDRFLPGGSRGDRDRRSMAPDYR